MTLESNKTLAGVGAILFAIPFLSLVGIILLLIAMKGLSEHYQDENIFKNTLLGFVFGIIGAISLTVIMIPLLIVFSQTGPYTRFVAGTELIIPFAIMYIFSLIGAIFYRKALILISEKTNEKNFETASILLIIGAIIPIIGGILSFVGWILAAVGFFSINEITQQTIDQTVGLVSEEKRFCQYCGNQINNDTLFCQKCGKKVT